MIVIDKDNKNLVIPNGLGNINRDYQEGYEIGYQESFEDGKAEGLAEGRAEGLAEGKAIGIEEGKQIQKDLLEAITITENGTYNKEDGYNQVVVEVPDTNGSYDEGYADGEAAGVENAGAIIAETARVLNITENGIYLSKYSDPYIPEVVTGYFDDGTPFYSYALIQSSIYSTGIIPNQNTRLEFWFKSYGTEYESWEIIIGSQSKDDASDTFQIRRYLGNKNNFIAEIGTSEVNFTMSENEWHHIIMSVADGFVLDGTKIGDFSENMTDSNTPLQIGGSINFNGERTEEGYYGMIKITTNGVENIIIPTAGGLKNITTDEMLQVVQGGSYNFTEELPIIPEGNLIKTINVDVVPKIDVAENGIKLAYSTFTEVPDFYDFEGVTNMSYMFSNCNSLLRIPLIPTSKVTDMSYMFDYCYNLQTIPALDTSKLESLYYTFRHCDNLTTIPQIDTSKVSNLQYTFNYCKKLQSLPAFDASSFNQFTISGTFRNGGGDSLTDFGGFQNLKFSITDQYCLAACPNLSYQSCINVLNGLYDFTGNGETPASNQGQLKVHQNFIDLVGDEISIGINKGWTITA